MKNAPSNIIICSCGKAVGGAFRRQVQTLILASIVSLIMLLFGGVTHCQTGGSDQINAQMAPLPSTAFMNQMGTVGQQQNGLPFYGYPTGGYAGGYAGNNNAATGYSPNGYAAAPNAGGAYVAGNGLATNPQFAAAYYAQMQAAQVQAMGQNQAMSASMMAPMPQYGYAPQIGALGYGGLVPDYSGYQNYGYQNYGQPNYYGSEQQWQEQQDANPMSPRGEKTSQKQGSSSAGGMTGSPYAPLRSPLLETTYETAKLMSPFNAPDGPHRGIGHPLEDQSWLDRPYYAGVFGGWNFGGELVGNQIDQGSGSDCGVALGWNINHYWGLEGRLFGASLNISDISGNVPKAPERSNKLTTLDVSVHYYPFGEARWRPYFKLGIGSVQERFTDNFGVSQKYNTWGAPFGVGLKYWWSDKVSVYADLVDNVVFGKDMTKTHGDWTFNFGVNFSFGTNPNHHPTVYWPQTTSMPY